MTMPQGVQRHLIFHENLIRAYLPPKYWDRESDYFVEGVEFNTLGASAANAVDTFTVQNESDFLVFGISAIETTTAAGTTEQTFWPVTVRFFDTGSGASWFGDFKQLHNVAGRGSSDGQGYRPLRHPRLVVGGSTVTVEANNLEATARRLWIDFHGAKIFRRPRT